jgi:hypothetical protein
MVKMAFGGTFETKADPASGKFVFVKVRLSTDTWSRVLPEREI